jgi:hypothetical protein
MAQPLRVLVVSALGFFAPAVYAETVCLGALQRGQDLQQRGQLRAAQEQYKTCGGVGCPREIGEMCWSLHSEVEKAQPTVVFIARSGADDVSGVSVTIDGVQTVTTDNGLPVSLDPGRHQFRFALPDGGERTTSATLLSGIKNREIVVSFGHDKRRPWRDIRPITWLLGGLGLAATATFAGLIVSADSASDCAPNCSDGATRRIRTTYAAAYGALGVGVLAFGVGSYTLLWPTDSESRGAGLRKGGVVLGVSRGLSDRTSVDFAVSGAFWAASHPNRRQRGQQSLWQA